MKFLKCVLLLCIFTVCFFCYNYYAFFIDQSGNFFALSRTSNYNLFNLVDFNYTISSELCSLEKNVFVLVIVTSFAGNTNARNALRRAYPKEELLKLGIIRIFLLAQLRKGQSRTSQKDIEAEGRYFGDVLQGNFFEAYRNLTYKHIMGLKWGIEKCAFMKYFIKMDDDIIVDFYGLINHLSSNVHDRSVTLMGYVLEGQDVRRDRQSKWYVSQAEYASEHYPKFLSGWLYVTTPMVASRLINASFVVPYYWIDDVYVTGLLAKEARIPHQDISSLIAPFTELIDCCIRDKLYCKFIAGPSNGYYALHSMYKTLMDKCRKGLCHYLIPGKQLAEYCTVKWKLPIDTGKAIVQQFNLG